TSGFVVRMLLDGHCMGSSLAIGAVAVEAQGIAGLSHHGNVFAPMWVVATKAGDPARIHQTLDEIVSLHTVLVGGSIWEMRERRFGEFVVLKGPIIRKVLAYFKPDRPIVVLSSDRIGERPTLGMTLDAGIIGMNVIEPLRIEDIVARRAVHVRCARPVAS